MAVTGDGPAVDDPNPATSLLEGTTSQVSSEVVVGTGDVDRRFDMVMTGEVVGQIWPLLNEAVVVALVSRENLVSPRVVTSCCLANLLSAMKASTILHSQGVTRGAQQYVLIERYGRLNKCQYGVILSQYGHMPFFQCLLSGQYNFRTLRYYGIIAHNTQRI